MPLSRLALLLVAPLCVLSPLSEAWAKCPRCERREACAACLRKAKEAREDDHFRAGDPQRIAWYARLTDAGHYSGGWVGGGKFLPGDEPCIHEGTWGWDFKGLVPVKRIWLGWSHGRCEEGGAGAYESDGPHLRGAFIKGE